MMSCAQKQSVPNIEPFTSRRLRPRYDVCGLKRVFEREPAKAAPLVRCEQCFSEQCLSYSTVRNEPVDLLRLARLVYELIDKILHSRAVIESCEWIQDFR